MSRKVKILMPLIDSECIELALQSLAINYTLKNSEYILSLGYELILKKENDQWMFFGEDYLIRTLRVKLIDAYEKQLNIKIERIHSEELARMEEERLKCIRAQKEKIIQKAKKMGYNITEKKVDNKIKLVLVRRTY